MCIRDSPDNLEDVNHKNFNRADNHVSNLEWKTHGDNVRYSIEAKRIYAHFILDMTKQDIARAEGVHEKVIRVESSEVCVA